MTRQQLLLAMLAASDGHFYEPVQIQKAIFLVTRNLPDLVDEDRSYRFQPYDYGPFDSQVYSDARELRNRGLALISTAASGNWSTYAASEQGYLEGRQILDRIAPRDRNYIRRISRWVRELSFAQLVAAIYNEYPEMRENSVFKQ